MPNSQEFEPHPHIIEAQNRIGELLRPMATLLAIAFLANAAWLSWRDDESKAHYYIAILNTVLLFSLRLFLTKKSPAPKLCEPIVFAISMLVVAYALVEARMDNAPWSTTQIIMVLLVGGFVFNSRNWLSSIAAVACGGWFWAALPNLSGEAWVNLGAYLLIAVIWSVWFLEIRLRMAHRPVPVQEVDPEPPPPAALGGKDTSGLPEHLKARDDTTLFKERAAAAAKRAHLLLRRQADLATMTTRPGEKRGLEDILSIAAAAAHRWLPVGVGAFVLLRDQESGRFTLGAASARGRFKNDQLFSEHVLVGAILVERAPLIVPSVGEADAYKIRELYEGERVDAFAALPMWGPDGLLGILVALDGASREFAPTELEFLTILAHQTASSIVMLRLQNARNPKV